MVQFFISFIVCATVSVIVQVILYRRSVFGEMDVEWNEDDQMFNTQLHIPSMIDYSKKKKLILIINKKRKK